ncbi:MAG: hypothetical protein CSB23_00790 [Deltaproteobacteria bacterium]|nr:MAG: hypothetical protein CSB23_00790 [Deltaproteobacteria bacterium]
MPGKFEMYKDKGGKFRFRLKAGNGQIILSSQGYKNKAGCMNGVKSTQKNAAIAERFEKTETKAGKFAFSLRAANKQIVGSSQQYKTTVSRDKGIASVMRNAPEASIVEIDL